jgi:putative ABC transport system permease protein
VIPWVLLPAHARKGFLRTLLTVGSVSVALFLYCTLRTVITSIERTVTEGNSSRLIVQSALSLFAHLPISMQQKLEPIPGVTGVTHWTWFGGLYIDQQHFFARFMVDVPSMRKTFGDRSSDPDMELIEGSWEEFEKDRTGCIVGRGLLERFRDAEKKPLFALGNVVPIQGDIYPGDYRFTVRGVYKSHKPNFDESTMFFHWNYVDETTGRRGEVSTFTLLLDDPAHAPQVAQAVDDQFANSATRTRTLTEQAFNLQFMGMWGNLPVFLTFIGGAILFAAFMVTLNTLLLNARERISEVGVLKTLGFPDGAIGMLNMVEALVLCLLGGALGTGIAILLFNHSSFGMSMDAFVPGFRVVTGTAAEAMGIALAIGLVSGLIPSLYAARIPLVNALRRIG